MQNFIAEVLCLALQLQAIGITVNNEDIILVLTGGLPSSYDNFFITLDSTSPADLTLDYVITGCKVANALEGISTEGWM